MGNDLEIKLFAICLIKANANAIANTLCQNFCTSHTQLSHAHTHTHTFIHTLPRLGAGLIAFSR